jgi:hypothetical protein
VINGLKLIREWRLILKKSISSIYFGIFPAKKQCKKQVVNEKAPMNCPMYFRFLSNFTNKFFSISKNDNFAAPIILIVLGIIIFGV